MPSLAQFDRAIAYMETTLASRKVAHHLNATAGKRTGLALNRLIETPNSQRCGDENLGLAVAKRVARPLHLRTKRRPTTNIEASLPILGVAREDRRETGRHPQRA
jgi:hypothetical protein